MNLSEAYKQACGRIIDLEAANKVLLKMLHDLEQKTEQKITKLYYKDLCDYEEAIKAKRWFEKEYEIDLSEIVSISLDPYEHQMWVELKDGSSFSSGKLYTKA